MEDSDLYLVIVIFSYNGIDIFCYCDIVMILLSGYISTLFPYSLADILIQGFCVCGGGARGTGVGLVNLQELERHNMGEIAAK